MSCPARHPVARQRRAVSLRVPTPHHIPANRAQLSVSVRVRVWWDRRRVDNSDAFLCAGRHAVSGAACAAASRDTPAAGAGARMPHASAATRIRSPRDCDRVVPWRELLFSRGKQGLSLCAQSRQVWFGARVANTGSAACDGLCCHCEYAHTTVRHSIAHITNRMSVLPTTVVTWPVHRPCFKRGWTCAGASLTAARSGPGCHPCSCSCSSSACEPWSSQPQAQAQARA